jgi:hypothetical protein
LGILLSLILSFKVVQIRRIWLKALAYVGAVLGLVVALAAKETSLAALVVYTAWLALTWFYRRLGWDRRSLTPYWVNLSAALLVGAVFFILRGLYVPIGLTAGGYTSGYQLTVGNLAASVLRWLGWLLRDFNYLLPLLAVVLSWSAWKRRFRPSLEDLELLAWMGVWMAIFLPWTYTVEYYMLPFAAGCVLFGSRLVERVVSGPLNAGRSWRWLSVSGLLAAFLLWLLTLPNILSNGRLQLAVDRSNAQMLSYLAASVPQGGEVVINMPADLEYVHEIRLHLNHLYGRPDIQTDRFFFQGPIPGEEQVRSYTLISPWIENAPRHSVRVGVYPEGAQEWLRALQDFLGGSPRPAWEDRTGFRLLVIDLPRLFCPLLGERNFCAQPGPVFSRETFRYGWQVYPVSQDAAEISQPGAFRDGTWILRRLDGTEEKRNFGAAGDLPLACDFDGDGLTDLAIYRPNEQTWQVDLDRDGEADRLFSLPGMQASDLPLCGDFDGDGIDTPAFYRPADGSWSFFNSLEADAPDRVVQEAGKPDAQPLVGDWNGDGLDTFGLYLPQTGALDLENRLQPGLGGVDHILAPQAVVVPGRWSGRPGDTLAAWSAGEWSPVMALCDCQPSNPPKSFSFGDPEGIPVQGIWREP